MERLEVRYQMKVSDFAFAMENMPWAWRWLGPLSIPAVALVPVTVWILAENSYAVFAIAIVWSILGLLAIMPREGEREREKHLRDLGEISLSIQPEYIETASKHGWSRRSWHCIESVRVVARHVIVRIKPMSFYVIPLDAFPSFGEARRMAALAGSFRQREALVTPVALPAMPASMGDESKPFLIRVSFEKNREELIRFCAIGDRSNEPFASGRVVVARIVLAALLLFFVISWLVAEATWNLTIEGSQSLSLLRALILLFFSIGIGLKVARVVDQWKVRTTLASLPLSHETLTITAWGVQVDGFFVQSRQSWLGIDRISETLNYILFWQGPMASHLIPKRAFASPTDISRFLLLARDAMASSRIARDDDFPANQITVIETGNPYQPPQAI